MEELSRGPGGSPARRPLEPLSLPMLSAVALLKRFVEVMHCGRECMLTDNLVLYFY